MDFTVYLAGPVTGTAYIQSTGWRNLISNILEPAGIRCLDPMRGQEYLEGSDDVSDSYEGLTMSTQRAIMTKSYTDTLRADAVIVNFLDSTRVSIGTVMEVAWAHENKIPIILIIEPEGNLHDHSMIREAAGFRVATIAEAAKVAKTLLDP